MQQPWLARKTRTAAALALGIAGLGLAACQTGEPDPANPAQVVSDAAGAEVADADHVGAHPGEAVYAQACASCHDQPELTRSPSKETLQAMRFQFLNFSLTEGKMKVQGAALSSEERGAVISYLTGRDTSSLDQWAEAMMCPADRRDVDLSGEATVTTFGFSRSNARELSAEQAGLTAADLSDMEIA